MNTGETDPLIDRGDKVLEEDKTDSLIPTASLAYGSVLSVVPFIWFLAAALGIWAFWHHEPVKFGVLFGILAMITCLIGFASRGVKAWLVRLTILTALGAIVGLLCGLSLYYKYLVYFRAYGDMNSYTNVAASQNPEQFADAGMVLWSSDSMVDGGRSVGYRDKATATTICVAPVTDGSMGPGDPVGFWAVGMNCCEPRANFHCDGASKGGARASVVLLESDLIASLSMQPIVEWLGGHTASTYDAALNLESAAWSTVRAEHVRFVRWTDDPVGMADVYRQDGMWFLARFALFYLLFSIATGILCVPGRPNPNANKARQKALRKDESKANTYKRQGNPGAEEAKEREEAMKQGPRYLARE